MAMAASVKQLAIVVCLISLTAGSLCEGYIHGKTLNSQCNYALYSIYQGLGTVNIEYSAPECDAVNTRFSSQKFDHMLFDLAPLKPAASKQICNPPSQPAPKEYDALPGPVSTKQYQDAYKSVNCGDRLSGGVRRRRKAFVRKYEN